METAVNYLEDRVMYMSTDETKWKRRIEQWAKEYPEECEITVRPENNDGCMCAKMPAGWLRIRPPIKRNMTEEQRSAIAERMRKFRDTSEDTDEEEDGEEDDA